MGTISIRFATNDIRDLSDGEVPAEVWSVYTSPDGTTRERHEGTATKRHRIVWHVKRAARGLRFDEKKHVEIRTPEARKAGDARAVAAAVVDINENRADMLLPALSRETLFPGMTDDEVLR